MRVLMSADTIGGVWSYAMELARALTAHRVEVVLATLGAPASPEQRREAAELTSVELRDGGYRLEWMPDPWTDVERAGHWLQELAAEMAPDIVHLNHYAHGAIRWPVPVVLVGHSCVMSWWQAVHGEPAPSQWDRYRRVVGDSLAAANAVVTPTEAMLTALRCHYSAPFRGRVIANGRRATAFPPGVKRPYVFAAGRLWDEAKNFVALDACARLLPWPICVAGDPRPPAQSAGRPLRRLHWLGRLDARGVAAWMACASIYALPARYEPFGLSALEAALAGCALVLGDIDSLREIWGGAAWFVDPEDPAALCAALTDLIANEPARRELAVRGRRRALQLDAGTMAARYHHLYRELIGGTEGQRRCAS